MEELVNIPALSTIRYDDGVTHGQGHERILAMHVNGKYRGQLGKPGCYSNAGTLLEENAARLTQFKPGPCQEKPLSRIVENRTVNRHRWVATQEW